MGSQAFSADVKESDFASEPILNKLIKAPGNGDSKTNKQR